jgi:hypothetical protein
MSLSTEELSVVEAVREDYLQALASPGVDPLAVIHRSAIKDLPRLFTRESKDAAARVGFAPYDDSDDAVVALSAECAIIEAFKDPISRYGTLGSAVLNTTRQTARNLSPVSIPASWWRVKESLYDERSRREYFLQDEAYGGRGSPGWFRLVATETSLSQLAEAKDPDIDELQRALFATYFLDALSRKPEPLTGRAGSALAKVTKTGLLAALDSIRTIDALRVSYRPPTPSETKELRALFTNIPAHHLTKGVTSPTAFEGNRSHTPKPLGLHSQVLFGPLRSGSCACGRYAQSTEVLTCERCGVTTGDSSLRSSTTSFITLPPAILATKSVTVPGRKKLLEYIPVSPPHQRDVVITSNSFVFSTVDRIYTRMLVTCQLIEALGGAGDLLAPQAAALLSQDLLRLVHPANEDVA